MRHPKLMILTLCALPLTGCFGGGQEEGVVEEKSAGSQAIDRLLAGEGAGKELVTRASGLQYVDLATGRGDSPGEGRTCATHATLWLLDGSKIWSSRDPGPGGLVQPFEFKLGAGEVIPGWEEGVADMRVGGRRRLAVPPELGYGEAGRPPVPPSATLIFEVELLEIRD